MEKVGDSVDGLSEGVYSLGEEVSDSDHASWSMGSSVSAGVSTDANDETVASYEALACISISIFDEERLWVKRATPSVDSAR